MTPPRLATAQKRVYALRSLRWPGAVSVATCTAPTMAETARQAFVTRMRLIVPAVVLQQHRGLEEARLRGRAD